MTSESKSFQDISREIAKRFIQTVVMVDDQAFRQQAEERPEPVREPPNPFDLSELADEQPFGDVGGEHRAETHPEQSQGNQTVALAADGGFALQAREATAPTQNGNHTQTSPSSSDSDSAARDEDLEAKKLIHLFARNGLVCSVIEPDKQGEPSASEAVRVARRADVLVLDWQIRKDEGKTAKEILRSVLSEDAKRGGRLRLVAFYTGSLNFSVISKDLSAVLTEVGLKAEDDKDQLAFTDKHVRVVVLAKQNNQELPRFKVRHVTTEQLPDQLVAEFARLTEGLVSNVVLEGFSVLRDATHAVLANLHTGLDPAYLTHRALQTKPDDAIDHVIDLVASEITALLHGFEVGNVSNFDAVAAWLKSRKLNSLVLGKASVTCTQEDVERLLKIGFATWKKSGVGVQAGKIEAVSTQLTRAFAKSSDDETGDAEFAVATSTTRRYGEQQPPPRLTLGTVLQENSNQSEPMKYWVCIQPRCDSVRIQSEGRAFLFVPADAAKDNKFDLVLDRGGANVRLMINEKPYGLKSLVFVPREGEDVIRTMRKSDRYVFEQKNMASEFVWVAQLKEAHAQRILSRFAARLARVGLNESEWLRLSSERKE